MEGHIWLKKYSILCNILFLIQIQNIVIKRIKQTNKFKKTFDLGGDEWMVLAEGLGLTPEEIRFLDKRTLNPMEAALSFIAKQRFLSVGKLYELLNESGFPALADRL